MRFFSLYLLAGALVTLLPCAAQTVPAPDERAQQRPRPDPAAWVSQQHDAAQMEEARRRAADYEEHQFQADLRELALLWNDFVAEYENRHTFNVKKARALRKALHKIEPELPK